MKTSQVEIGGIYAAEVSGSRTRVRILGRQPVSAFFPRGGWYAANLTTGRQVFFRSAQRLRFILTRGQAIAQRHGAAIAVRIGVGQTIQSAIVRALWVSTIRRPVQS